MAFGQMSCNVLANAAVAVGFEGECYFRKSE